MYLVCLVSAICSSISYMRSVKIEIQVQSATGTQMNLAMEKQCSVSALGSFSWEIDSVDTTIPWPFRQKGTPMID